MDLALRVLRMAASGRDTTASAVDLAIAIVEAEQARVAPTRKGGAA
jgi:hypothetical protein